MTSSKWICESARALRGFGADCESIARFAELLSRETHPLPSAFTVEDVARARSSRDPARSLCAAFCAKEAVAKAVGALYDLTACELLSGGEEGEGELRLRDAFRREHGVAFGRAAVREVPGAPGEILVVACLFA
jgi:phosphopantetheinyl transferase (holo-ACP synthase)